MVIFSILIDIEIGFQLNHFDIAFETAKKKLTPNFQWVKRDRTKMKIKKDDRSHNGSHIFSVN